MHQLTITTATDTTTTSHDDFDDAHRAMMSRVIAADLYLHADSPTPPNVTMFTLVDVHNVDELTRRPRVTGTAVIAPVTGGPVVPAEHSAFNALLWISQHDLAWHRDHSHEPSGRFPLAILHAAGAEAHQLFTAGTLYNQAAELAGVSRDEARPHQRTFDHIHAHVVALARSGRTLIPAELAAEVCGHLGKDTSPQQTAALIWWAALVMWGVNAD